MLYYKLPKQDVKKQYKADESYLYNYQTKNPKYFFRSIDHFFKQIFKDTINRANDKKCASTLYH